MKKITYFDVEYANSKNKSLCQIGLICDDFETGNSYYPKLNIYINPEDNFDEICIRVHGITKEKVAEELTFPEVWKEIEKYFTNAIVVGHNIAAADLDALVKNIKRYNLDIPQLYYICTYELSKEFIPRFEVENYNLSTLCSYFDIDRGREHDAFSDAFACSELFRTLVQKFAIDIDEYVQKYDFDREWEFTSYISNPVLRKNVSEFYGIIKGFSIDYKITEEEKNYIIQWKKDNQLYDNHIEIKNIVSSIDKILEDGIITNEEILSLQSTIKSYLDIVKTSPITLSTQVLNGIIKGITADNLITENEISNLRKWLYDNRYLEGHYPFDKLLKCIDDILADSIITAEELIFIEDTISSLLNPVESMRKSINTLEKKIVCLSGTFAYGEKKDVESYIVSHGGSVVSGVSKKIDYLIIGDYECQSYSNGTYGTKVKKAMELIEKGAKIEIVKESDLFNK